MVERLEGDQEGAAAETLTLDGCFERPVRGLEEAGRPMWRRVEAVETLA